MRPRLNSLDGLQARRVGAQCAEKAWEAVRELSIARDAPDMQKRVNPGCGHLTK